MRYFEVNKKNYGLGGEQKSMPAKQQEKKLKGFHEFWEEEDGMGTVEIILIIVVLIGLVIIFKNQLTSIVNKLFKKITNEVGKF